MAKDEKFLISSITIEELEDIKTSGRKTEDVRYAARKAVRFLNDNPDKYEVIIYDLEIQQKYLIDRMQDLSNDNEIIACAVHATEKYPDLAFISNDVLARLIAKEIFGLPVSKLETGDQIYTGYKEIDGNTEHINMLMANIDYSDWHTNEYLIIHNTDDDSTKEMRWDGTKFVALKLPPSKYIKAKNSLQRCALDALMNPDITIAAILGGYGSGKTFLSMQMALYSVQEKGYQSKILGVREPRGEGREVGFLPGTLEDKTDNFFLPLVQQLNGGEFELERLKQMGVLDSNIPYYLKGTTYVDTVILCDEAEDLTESQIRLVGTRLGEGSKIYFAGDYKQSLLNKTTDNALLKMCNTFKGDPKFACVYLGEDVRSSTSKMFADLFTN